MNPSAGQKRNHKQREQLCGLGRGRRRRNELESVDGLADTAARGTDSSGKVPGRRQLNAGSKTTEGRGGRRGSSRRGTRMCTDTASPCGCVAESNPTLQSNHPPHKT